MTAQVNRPLWAGNVTTPGGGFVRPAGPSVLGRWASLLALLEFLHAEGVANDRHEMGVVQEPVEDGAAVAVSSAAANHSYCNMHPHCSVRL